MTREELRTQTMEWKNNYIFKLEKENAELKAGKDTNVPTKWHDLRKDPNDLPKDENDVLVYSGEEWRMCVGRYSPKYKAWEAGCDTVAWCEIPKFEDKESD